METPAAVPPPSPNPSYLGIRHDMLAMVPTSAPLARVLDVGCASGATGRELKRLHPGLHVTGIELDAHSAVAAREHLDRVIEGEAARSLLELRDAADERFDLVMCGDVLEHLVDPWGALKLIRQLCPEGHAVVSLPNVAHLSTFAALLRSRWPYRDRGIHDRTHLRFFGRENLPELFAVAGFVEVDRTTHHRVIELPHPLNDRLAPLLSRLPLLGRLTEYQFVSLLRPLG